MCIFFFFFFFHYSLLFTWITLMFRPVSCDSCSRMCLVGFGVAANAAFSVSSCLALMVVRGPRRFPTAPCSSFSLPHASLSDKCPVSESFPSSCGSWESGDMLGSLQEVTVRRKKMDVKIIHGKSAEWKTTISKIHLHLCKWAYLVGQFSSSMMQQQQQ